MFTKVVAGFLAVASLNVYAQVQDSTVEFDKRMKEIAHDLRREKAQEEFNAICMENMKTMKVRVQAKKVDAEKDRADKTFKKDLHSIDKKLTRYLTEIEANEACDAAASIYKEAMAKLGKDSITYGAWGVVGGEINPVKIPVPGPFAVSPGGKLLFGRGWMKTRTDKMISTGVFIYGGQTAVHMKSSKVATFEGNAGILVAVAPEHFDLASGHDFKSVLSIDNTYVGVALEGNFAFSETRTTSISGRILLPISTEDIREEDKTLEKLLGLVPSSKPVLVFIQFGFGAKSDAGKVDFDFYQVQANEIIEGK